ncbi:MAG: aldo/keto reductase [Verrucomicrobia bacterium]|nr:aldo/keto reductase [Verrucomicrobiota bacterium]
MKRRTFLKTVSGVAGSLALGPQPLLNAAPQAAPAPVETVAGLPRRVLGRTGRRLSIVGFPGLSLIHYSQSECDAGVRKAFDKGVNYFDVAPAYGNGTCETRMGVALQGLDRSQYFLACKTKMRDAEGARKELETSLRLLKTDHFDLYQLHHLVKPEDVKKALGPGGALETFLKAKKEGKVNYLGFSAHTTKAALAALKGFNFDTVMFPINFVEYYLRDFGKAVMALANERGAALLAIKPMSRGAWPRNVERTRKWWYRSVEEKHEVDLAWRFTLSQPGVVAGIPPSFLDLLDKAIDAAKDYQPPTAADLGQLQTIAKNCESIFVREESMVAGTMPCHGPAFPDSPHECGGGHWT